MNVTEFRLNLVEQYLKELQLSEKIKNYFCNRTILVTGGAGAIGSNLVITLSRLVGNDGKIIVFNVEQAIRIRTKEKNEKAI